MSTPQVTRTGIVTHPIVSTTPRGEIHLHSSAALGRHLFLSREKALSLAQALTLAAGEEQQ